MLVLANVRDEAARVEPSTLSGFAAATTDLIADGRVDLPDGVTAPACGVLRLRTTPR